MDGARAWCETVLAQTTSTAERVELLDGFASLPLLRAGTRALLPDAQRWCAEAVILAPDQPTLRGTQGSLLVEQDECAAAWPILLEVFARTGSEQDRGICAFYLALAAQRLGHADDLNRYRHEALRCCKEPHLLKRLHTELKAA